MFDKLYYYLRFYYIFSESVTLNTPNEHADITVQEGGAV